MAAFFKTLYATRRPRQRQAYVVWQQSQCRPELDVAIDAHHARAVEEAVQQGRPSPSRGVSWNIVVAEHYKLASAEEKEETRKQVESLYAQELAIWETQSKIGSISAEEAIECIFSQSLQRSTDVVVAS